eukprot:797262-Amorphochlora_amoeboformis.AAC.1
MNASLGRLGKLSVFWWLEKLYRMEGVCRMDRLERVCRMEGLYRQERLWQYWLPVWSWRGIGRHLGHTEPLIQRHSSNLNTKTTFLSRKLEIIYEYTWFE